MGDIIQHEQLQCCRKSIEKTKGYKDKTGETDATVRKERDRWKTRQRGCKSGPGKRYHFAIPKIEINVTESLEDLLLKSHLQPEQCPTKRKRCTIINYYENTQSKLFSAEGRVC